MGRDIRDALRAERAYETRQLRRQCPTCGRWFINSKRKGWHCSNKCAGVGRHEPKARKKDLRVGTGSVPGTKQQSSS